MKLVIFDFAGTILSGKEIEQDIVESIRNLSSKYTLTIVSSASSSYIKDYLEKKDILSNFSDILESRFFFGKKDRIGSLLKKYNTLGVDAIYITDTLGDIKEAALCGVSSIAVTWGLDDEEKLKKGNPVKIVDNPKNLVSSIESVLK
jgi:phosphoglycolate phosphatase-like HAD superfamily hydrolase